MTSVRHDFAGLGPYPTAVLARYWPHWIHINYSRFSARLQGWLAWCFRVRPPFSLGLVLTNVLPTPASKADIRNSFGAAFIGLLVSTTLFGLTIVQTWIYFWNYWKDSKLLKVFVVFVTTMDGFHAILCAYVIYWYLILNSNNVEKLSSSMWVLNICNSEQSYLQATHTTSNAAADVVSDRYKYHCRRFRGAVCRLCAIFILLFVLTQHSYYARRVYVMSQSIVCLIVIGALVIIASFFGIFFTVKEAVLKQFDNFHSLTYQFRFIDGFVVSPSSLTWLAIFWVMSRCYVNTLLALLNSRAYLHDRSIPGNLEPDNVFNLSSIRVGPSTGASILFPRTVPPHWTSDGTNLTTKI
ncbi:hypothetical protein H4582DRAFT_2053704 [Lactarius indigo]|nr:hypothetical protein H4582DRAFT_2053704 [Lactarius indigo]